MNEQIDRLFMERALLVAERGRGRTTPNPNVGAVVVSPDGIVVGQGAHLVAGGPHAEVIALDRAADRARGATVYCTLEPCSHVGRTGPCTERILAAGVRRVVVGALDPNPLVSGRGVAFLREHGIDVVTGVLGAEAAHLHAAFFTWVTRHRPFVIAKTATSADGFVGRATERVQITGASADRYFQRQRAEIDAIAVGSGTVIVDDPRLTARGVYRHRPLTRVIVDWRGRVPVGSRVYATLAAGPVIMIMTTTAGEQDPARVRALRSQGVRVELFGQRDLHAVLGRLAALDVVCLLLEGGPTLQRAFADAGLIDRLQVVTSPRALGHGVRGISVPADSPVFAKRLGPDTLMEFDVHWAG